MGETTAPVLDHPGRWIVSCFGPPHVLKWEVLSGASITPAANEVVIRIIVAGIAGADNLQRVGGYLNERCKAPGFTPGFDCVGEIISAGVSVDSCVVGDRVVTMCMTGAYATHVVAQASEIITLKSSDDPIKICALPLNYMTAWGMLKHSGISLKPGSTILIGSVAGGIGTALAQLVHAFDLPIKMIGSCSPTKFDYVRSLGVIPVDRSDPYLWANVRGLTQGDEGVDVAFDGVGTFSSLEQSHKSCKDDVGQIVMFGRMGRIAADGGSMAVDTCIADLAKYQHFPRMTLWSTERHYYHPRRELWKSDFTVILGKVRIGKLNPRIVRLFNLKDAVQAHECLVSGAGVMGKMEFIVDAELSHKLTV